ncbi:DUF4382 domain-containing protein [Taibaiella helva]|uniref:DUF4382 domain-containing protein n=1 Tax=Taibaiella helva TaxID=2301235 RepID=UPI001300767D|nr:DUF4382 domain-containing protein [Taibaiella helva]
MKKRPLVLGLCVLGLLSLLASCKKDDAPAGTATMNIHLTDGPGNYDAVLIDVQQIEIHSDINGWVTVNPVHPGVYNLLDFRNGADTLLCQAQLPAGNISQMRLVLGSSNSVVVDGVTYPLSTPSAQQSGLKFNIHQELVPNGSYHFWIDFDAGRSIVKTGNGAYSLKPVIRTYTELTNGKIKGYVLPPAADATVYAINGADTFSAIPAADGYFLFCGLPEGNYNLWFDALDATNYQDSLMPNVPVTFGNINDVGIVTLIQ